MRGQHRLLIALAILAGIGLLLATNVFMPFERRGDATQALYQARLQGTNGEWQNLSHWRGKILIVNFWATWCPPCLEEMPELSALQDAYRERGVVVVGIASDDVARISQFALATRVSYPLLAGDLEAMRLAALLGNSQGVLPYTVLIDGNGSLAARHVGRVDIPTLEKQLAALLAQNWPAH